MKKFYLLLCVCATMGVTAQENAWVFFKDKQNVQESLKDPNTILTQKAIDRKNRNRTIIDERDVPVNENYIQTIKNLSDIVVLAKSKWFNCIFVRGSEAGIRNLLSYEFVASIDFADNSLDGKQNDSNRIPNLIKNEKYRLEKITNFDYGAATSQTEQLKVDDLHNNGFSGQGMTIAVMDSGFPNVDINEGFRKAIEEGRILEGYDFPRRNSDEFTFQGSSHGSLVLSDMAGFIEGQFVGTAPNASYHLFITEDVATEGPLEEAYWVEAAERADSLGVDVINTSLGYSAPFDNPAYEYTTNDMDGQTTFISRGANIAFEKGMIPVVSAGNSGDTAWGIVTAPGDAPGALTIGAVDATGAYASFSSRGPTADNRTKPDVVSRGSNAAVINTNGSLGSARGTSFSAPIMAGAVACLWQAFPEKTNTEIMELIRQSASQFDNPTDQLGYGIPDFNAILQRLDTGSEDFPELKIVPNPVADKLRIEIKNHPANLAISIFAMDGRRILTGILKDDRTVLVSGLSPGLYVLYIEEGKKQYIRKILKK